VIFVILIISLFIELKYMRPKRRNDIEGVIERDHAYNALSTSTAISASLKGMGKDTRDAEMMLVRAQMEFDRKDYAKVVGTTKAARELMINARDTFQIAPEPAKVVAQVDEEEVKPDEKTVHEAKKLPENYLESKFLINTTKVERHLADAEKCFESGRYGDAVRICMQARRSLTGKQPSEHNAHTTSIADISSDVGKNIVTEPRIDMEQKVPEKGPETHIDALTCAKCGSPLTSDDEFCGKCGTKVVQEIACKKCGMKMSSDDAFCRKCGNPLD
jgi:RNA polymerase subunit RPABC4/transcription elongation factor Spt4